jgi:hypothetical protein
MTTGQLISPPTINKYIREEMTKQLHANGIYQLDSYGWIDADTHDPDLVGHAMWQTDPPSWRLLEMDSPGSIPPNIKPWQKFLVKSGGDFEGLMKAARLSLGLALFFQHASVEEDTYTGDSFLQVHLMGSLLTLSTASDRLRDLFIAAVFHKQTEKYVYKNKERAKNYATPFREALAHLHGSPEPLAGSLSKLPLLAERIGKYRTKRNKIVHVLATEQGRLQQHLINNPPRPITDHIAYEELTDEMLRDLSDSAEAEPHQSRIVDDIDTSTKWYELLIKTSNHVFIVENKRRA